MRLFPSRMLYPLLAIATALPATSSASAADARTDVRLNLDWAQAAFAASPAGDADPNATPSGRLLILHEDYSGDTKINRSAAGGAITMDGKEYARGVGVNSNSALRVELPAPGRRFKARIGLDENVRGTAASVRFEVSAAGRTLLRGDVVRAGEASRSIDLPLNGARTFELKVDDAGDGRHFDQGNWADTRVVLEDGTEMWLDDLPLIASRETSPFSFTYGGKPSSQLLPTWERESSTETTAGGAERHVLQFTDRQTGLRVRAEATAYSDLPGAEWVVSFHNAGSSDLPLLEELCALDVMVPLPPDAAATLARINGAPNRPDDWLPFDQPLEPQRAIDFAATGGRSSNVSPFFTVHWDGGDEQTGGIATAIGWSGQWQATVERVPAGVRFRAGLQDARLSLRPGETIRGPRIFQLRWSGGGPWRGYNLFRRVMLAHYLPRSGGQPVPPPIAHLSTSFYEMNATTERDVFSHLESIKGLGFEVFWLDAYWHAGGFPRGIGNYVLPLERAEPADRFPRGVRPVGEATRAAGMKFLLWFEPERVAPGTLLWREHPEWVLTHPTAGGEGNGLLDLGNPAARDHLKRYLLAAIDHYGVDWLRIDYNIDPLEYWRAADAKAAGENSAGRAGVTEIRYVEGLYQLWDDLLAARPGLMIDNCASGGRRIDLETTLRSVPLWRTDATIDPLLRKDHHAAAIQNQVMTAGLGRYLPFHTSGQMGFTPYLFRSGFNGGISFAEDCRPKDYPRHQLAGAITEAKRLRRYYSGDLYPLSPVTLAATDWCVLQYDRPEQGEGMVVAFRRHESPYASFECRLERIDDAVRYEVTLSEDFTPGPPSRMSGAELRRIRLTVESRPGSVVLEYRRVD